MATSELFVAIASRPTNTTTEHHKTTNHWELWWTVWIKLLALALCNLGFFHKPWSSWKKSSRRVWKADVFDDLYASSQPRLFLCRLHILQIACKWHTMCALHYLSCFHDPHETQPSNKYATERIERDNKNKNKINRYLDKLPWPQELNNCTQNILSLAWRRTHHCVRILPCILQGLTWRNWRTTRNGLDGSYLMAPTWWLLVLLVLKPMKPMSVTRTACGNIWAFRCNSLQGHKHHHRTSQNHQPLGIVMNCLDKIACPSTLQPWVFSETMVKLKKIQSPCLESWCLWWSLRLKSAPPLPL